MLASLREESLLALAYSDVDAGAEELALEYPGLWVVHDQSNPYFGSAHRDS